MSPVITCTALFIMHLPLVNFQYVFTVASWITNIASNLGCTISCIQFLCLLKSLGSANFTPQIGQISFILCCSHKYCRQIQFSLAAKAVWSHACKFRVFWNHQKVFSFSHKFCNQFHFADYPPNVSDVRLFSVASE